MDNQTIGTRNCTNIFYLRVCFLLLIFTSVCILSYHILVRNDQDKDHFAQFTEPTLLSQIRHQHLFPPVANRFPVIKSNNAYREHQMYHIIVLGIVLKTKKSLQDTGFFVEAGALDGHFLSHTLELDYTFHWTGLLVEPSPSQVTKLKKNGRKAWIADVCLTDKPYQKLPFMTKKNQTEDSYLRGNGKLAVNPQFEKGDNRSNYELEGEVECYSLYSLLKAIDNGPKVVDLLVLDIEGGEYKVLEAYPFHLLPIKVVAVEHWLTPEGAEKMVELMTGKGYMVEYQSVSDLVFILKSAKLDYSQL